MGQIQMDMIDHSVSSKWWKKLIVHFIRPGDDLEIRCWEDELEEIKQASSYGTVEKDGYEVSIRGVVKAELLTELLLDSSTDKSIYNKMTKYFTINTQNDLYKFSSEHYGTEIYIDGVSDDDISFFRRVMGQDIGCFSINIVQ